MHLLIFADTPRFFIEREAGFHDRFLGVGPPLSARPAGACR
jgi:hypothetical protein